MTTPPPNHDLTLDPSPAPAAYVEDASTGHPLTAQASAPATTATLPFVHPFFSNRKQGTDPDVILESCDGGRFYVHSMLLRMRSAHFRTVFEMTPGRVHDGLPVLECQEETAATLKCMLPYFYAQAPDDLFLHNRKDAAISDYKNGLRFEDKFQMDVTEDSSGTDKDAWAMGCNTAKSKIEKSLQERLKSMDGGATLDMFHAPRLDAHDRLVEGIIHKASLATKPAPTSTLAGIQDKELELLQLHGERCFRLQMMAPFDNRGICKGDAGGDREYLHDEWHACLKNLCNHSWTSVKQAIEQLKKETGPHVCGSCKQLWHTAVAGLEEMLDIKLDDEVTGPSCKRKR